MLTSIEFLISKKLILPTDENFICERTLSKFWIYNIGSLIYEYKSDTVEIYLFNYKFKEFLMIKQSIVLEKFKIGISFNNYIEISNFIDKLYLTHLEKEKIKTDLTKKFYFTTFEETLKKSNKNKTISL